MPDDLDDKQRFELMQKLRKITAEGRSIMLCLDPDEMNHKLLHNMRASAEVVLDLSTALIGGDLKRGVEKIRMPYTDIEWYNGMKILWFKRSLNNLLLWMDR